MTNRYETSEVQNTNSDTTVDITNTDYNGETVNNHLTKNKFDQNYYNIVCRWGQVLSNQHPENQTNFSRFPVVPGKLSYTDATKNRDKFHA